MKVTSGLVEQHIHGAFGYDFMTCTLDDVINVSRMLLKCGVTAFFPTIMTHDLSVIKKRIEIMKKAKSLSVKDGAEIAGIHLEGPFINREKAGIHDKKYILPLDVNLYKQIDDEIIKIVTTAPELDINRDFISYLKSKEIKVSAGHCLCNNLNGVTQVTHLYNAMGAFTHRNGSTVVSALVNNKIYTEIIADSMHVSDDVLKITFKQKDTDKVLLISDALPLAHSDKKEMIFAGQKIYNKDNKLVNYENVFAGSSMLLCDIVKNLAEKQIVTFDVAIQAASLNQLKYHNLTNKLNVYWNDDYTINKTEII